MSVIGGYYHLDADQTRELDGRLCDALRGRQVQGRRADARRRTPSACAPPARRPGPTCVLMVDANQGYERAQAVDFGRRVADLDIRWFEEPCRWTNDRRWMRDVRYQTGLPVAAGQSEVTLDGLRDLVVDGAIDVSQLRRLVGGRPDGLAQGGRPVRGVRGRAGSPRGAPGLRAPPRQRAAPHLRGVLRRGARPLLLAALRPVHRSCRTAGCDCRSGRASASTSTGSTWIGGPWIAAPARSESRSEPGPTGRQLARRASADRPGSGGREPPSDPADGDERDDADAGQHERPEEHGRPDTKDVGQPA